MSEEWQRLDPRTLITHPVSSALQTLLSAAIAIVAVGRSSGFGGAVLIGAVFVIVPGVLRWATTTYRVTPTHLEVRRGLLSRSTLTARIDRVRTIDAQAAPVHRLLGVAKLSIGTGVDEGAIELDAVSSPVAEQLRRALLHRSDGPDGTQERYASSGDAPVPTGDELVRLSWSWIRYAPLNVGQLLVAVGTAAALVGRLNDQVASAEVARAWHWFGDESPSALVLEALLVGVVAWTLLSTLGYAVRWAGLRLTREQGAKGTTLHLVHGALTQQSTTLEEAKVRGIVIRRRTLVGLAGGAELDVLTTGLGEEEARLLPSAPAPVVRAVADAVIGDAAAVGGAVRRHGAAAHRRCYGRALRRAAIAAVAALVATWVADTWAGLDLSWRWPVAILVAAVAVALPLAELHYRRLGHALTDRHLVSTAGGVTAVRTALETDGIIGWRIHRSFWDRRLGLAQLTATTAAGPEHVTVRDVPLYEAVAVAAAATPGMLAEFVDVPPVHGSKVRRTA